MLAVFIESICRSTVKDLFIIKYRKGTEKMPTFDSKPTDFPCKFVIVTRKSETFS